MATDVLRHMLEATGYLENGTPAHGVRLGDEAHSRCRSRDFVPDVLWRSDSALTVYFKHAPKAPPDEQVAGWRREIWNQGFAPPTFPGAGNMVVLPGTESRSRFEVLLPDGRTDIPVLWIEVFVHFGGHDPHAIIECKRIAGSNARLCREYVIEGIDGFRAGKYAGNHSTRFMAGNLIADDASTAAQGDNRYLNSPRGKRKPRQDENLAPPNLVGRSWAWASRHPRTARPAIELHLTFLPASLEEFVSSDLRGDS